MSESLVFLKEKNVYKAYQKIQFWLNFLSELLICSLHYHDQPEQITHGRSFVMSDLSDSLTFDMSDLSDSLTDAHLS